jgi:hypothetical protein
MDDMQDDEMFPFEINYDLILNNDGMMSITQDCVRAIRKNAYLTPGEFLQSVMNSDLQEALEVADDEEHDNYGDFMLLAEMLARAEGLDAAQDFEEMRHRMSLVVSFIVVESLHRKKMVKVYHDRMSFGDDMSKAVIVEKL